jgi:hypothetical protein
MRGNCYVAAEALYHILGGQDSHWVPHRMRVDSINGKETHWFLRHRVNGTILDPSRLQFGGLLPDYSYARGTGFLTKHPSARARALIRTLTWQP